MSVEGMNMLFQTGTRFINNPAINRANGEAVSALYPITLPTVSGNADDPDDKNGALAISTLRPGDITIKIAEHSTDGSFGSSDYGLGGAKLPTAAGDATSSSNIQSYNVSFDLSRSPIQRLGNRFAFAREIDFPVNVNLSVDAVLTDLTTGNLNDLVNCEKSYDIQIQLKGITGSACDGTKTDVAAYVLKDMKPDSQSYTSSIGDNKTVTLDFSTQLGGPRDVNGGIFFKGITQSSTALETITGYAS
jgi:hypothetical protein